MFTIDDFMNRYRDSLAEILQDWCVPENGFDDIHVRVSHNEFHDLCEQDSRIFTEKKVHWIEVIVEK